MKGECNFRASRMITKNIFPPTRGVCTQTSKMKKSFSMRLHTSNRHLSLAPVVEVIKRLVSGELCWLLLFRFHHFSSSPYSFYLPLQMSQLFDLNLRKSSYAESLLWTFIWERDGQSAGEKIKDWSVWSMVTGLTVWIKDSGRQTEEDFLQLGYETFLISIKALLCCFW